MDKPNEIIIYIFIYKFVDIMNKKLTTLLFGLLLAVGWTDVAQAQLKNTEVPLYHKYEAGRPQETTAGQPSRAPRRANVTANVVHDRAFYEKYSYTWSGGTSKITDKATNPDQMANMVKYIYTKKEIPGILFTAAHNVDHPYPNIEFGYNIAQAATSSTTYGDIYVNIPNVLFAFSSIEVYRNNSRVTYFYNGNYYGNVSWGVTSGLTSLGNGYYYFNSNSGSYFRIPASAINGYNNVTVVITGYLRADSGTDDDGNTVKYDDQLLTMNVNHQNKKWTTSVASYEFNIRPTQATGSVTPPTENGYTAIMVKVKDNINFDHLNDEFTYSWNDITNFFSKYIESLELMTDGLRVGEGTDAAGTVFAYSGILDKFYIITKGKMAYLSSLESSVNADRAPFYSMYEEFSPYVETANDNQKDLYANMRAGDYYPVLHDCQGVIYRDHFFSMAGKDTIAPKSVAPLVFYIPDNRGSEDTWRNYVDGFQPQIGLYTINLAAETEPSNTYAQDSTYTVYLDWTSSLNDMANNQVNQTYIIYKVEFDSLGNRKYAPLDTVYDVTNYQYKEKQQMSSQTFTYVIMGMPTAATNNPIQQQGGIFYVYSNLDDVQIPGLFDFMVLYRERYESDFSISKEMNYYRNYLYPTNLSPGTGMTMEQLKKEWPNQTASYTLWRDDRGIAKLEVRGIGNKVYYRIQYYENSQVTDSYNAIEMPYPYVEIPNENN